MKKVLTESEWIRGVIDQYEQVQSSAPGPVGVEEDWPDWVVKLLAGMMNVSHPGLNLRGAKKWRAKDLGRFLGRQFALGAVVQGELPSTTNFTTEAAKLAAAFPSIAALSCLQDKHAQDMEQGRLAFRQFIKELVTSACDRPLSEASEFFKAFGGAAAVAPDDFDSERLVGVGERIAFVMFVHWREIAEFESVAQLHQFLSHVVAPAGIIIEFKRIEKLCQRIGLKVKARGRPRKKKIQTNRPADV
jgi:hypothetical protein